MKELRERELEDDYPVHWGFLYVVDGKPWQSPDEMTVGELKRRGKFNSVMNCDIKNRNLWHLLDFYAKEWFTNAEGDFSQPGLSRSWQEPTDALWSDAGRKADDALYPSTREIR